MATSKTPAAPRTLDELKRAILDGQVVDPEEYNRARVLDELDQLQAEADRQAAERKAAAERHQRIRTAADNLLAAFDHDDTGLADAMITEGVRLRVEHYHTQARAFGQTSDALTANGVYLDKGEHSGVERRTPGMGLGERILVDGRAITPRIPNREIADAIDRGLEQAGERTAFLRPHVQVNPAPRTRVETEQQRQLREQKRTEALAYIAEQEERRTRHG